MLKEFKEFIMRGNVVDMAVGIIIGIAFGTIVNSLVKDIIMPPISLALGRVDFTNLFALLKAGPTDKGPYLSLSQAQAAGAVRAACCINRYLGHTVRAIFCCRSCCGLRSFCPAAHVVDRSYEQEDHKGDY